MSKHERIFGIVLSTGIVAVIAFAMFLSLFDLIFRDDLGIGISGGRGTTPYVDREY